MKVATFARSSMESKLADGVRLGADRVDAGVRAAAVRQLLDAVVDVLLHEIDRDRAGVRAPSQPLGHGVDGDDPLGAEQEGAADGELRDRSAAEDGDRLAAFDVAELGAHVAGREDVGQEQHLFVAQPCRHLDRADIGERHAQILRLAAREAAQQVRIAEQPGRRMAPQLGGLRRRSGLERSQPEK